MIKNDLNLRFNIWDYEDINDSEITESLSLVPYKVYIKGKQINPKSPRISKRNGWVYSASYGNGDDFKEQMDKILDVLEPKIPVLREYAKKYYCEFSCALFLNNREESAPYVQLDKRYNAFVREVDAEFDFNIYCPSLEE
ncbi:DUF4279 domain-containing protein [Chryseobacterium indologenes]|uniref:DUF4279 domain-containing protein n=1 Tax=Chryseobacterium indologenes TaxID=253 RepID=UPI0009A1D93B|nr:DUF4279 domain-containing protein [Chryseobacterium indologenes]